MPDDARSLKKGAVGGVNKLPRALTEDEQVYWLSKHRTPELCLKKEKPLLTSSPFATEPESPIRNPHTPASSWLHPAFQSINHGMSPLHLRLAHG